MCDGVIHLISSYNHYELNVKWIETPAPPMQNPEKTALEIICTSKSRKKAAQREALKKKGLEAGG